MDSNICTGSTPVPGTKPDVKASGFFIFLSIHEKIIDRHYAFRVTKAVMDSDICTVQFPPRIHREKLLLILIILSRLLSPESDIYKSH